MKRTIYSLFLTALFGMLGMHVCAQELSTTEIGGKTYYFTVKAKGAATSGYSSGKSVKY